MDEVENPTLTAWGFFGVVIIPFTPAYWFIHLIAYIVAVVGFNVIHSFSL